MSLTFAILLFIVGNTYHGLDPAAVKGQYCDKYLYSLTVVCSASTLVFQ